MITKDIALVIIMSNTHDWTRFWCISDQKPVISPEGYLVDPEYEFSPNSHLIVDPIKLDKRCLVLLGEPGIGKTTALEIFNREFESEEEKILKINLNGIGNATHFNDMIFNHAKFQDWLKGEHYLYLLLDSFDECFLRERVIANLLVMNLKEIPIERLNLRIACRAGYWPNSLNHNLTNIFGSHDVLSYTIAPLRKKDIEEAANSEVERTENTSPSDFIDKIESMEAGLFTSIPITLKALIQQYNQEGHLSQSKTDLYRFYCLYLCRETNETRRDERLSVEFTPEQKYIVAARIAALCAFSGKYSIWTSSLIETIQDECIPESILRQGHENALGQSFDITENCISETLSCGLFQSSRPVRRWAHWSFLEFLAAEYIIKKEIPTIQILSVIKNSYDRKIIPQLREVVAWLCSVNQDLYDKIIETEPEVLLQSDLMLFSDDKKEEIINQILQTYEKSYLKLRFFDLTSQYKKLNHPKLSSQIQEYIINPENPRDTRLFAIKIAEKCSLRGLIPLLIKLVLEDKEDVQIRRSAAYTLESFSINQNVERIEILKPIALTDDDLGEDYDLKGISLIILWPNHIKFDELIEHLPDAKLGYGGAYMRFLFQHFIEKLPNTEILSALNWIRKNPKMFMPLAKPYFDDILIQILLKSLSLINIDGVLEAFSQTLSALLIDGSYLRERWRETQFNVQLNEDQEQRRLILKCVLSILPLDKAILISFISHILHNYGQNSLFELIQQEDLYWLIEEVKITENEEYRENLAFIIYRMVFKEPDWYNIAYGLNNLPVFHPYYIRWFGPIDLDSDLASKMREDYEREQLSKEKIEQLQRNKIPAPLDPPLQERMKNHLDMIEQGNIHFWVNLNHEMMSEHGRTDNQSIFNPNLTSMPGWRLSSEEIHDNILSAAKNFVIEGEPKNQEWVGTDSISYAAYAGYRALRLILEMEPEWIRTLTTEIWQKWIPIILTYEFGIYGQNVVTPEEFYQDREDNELQINPEILFRGMLLKMGFPEAKTQLVETVLAQIDNANEQSHSLNFLDRIDMIFDDFIGKSLQDLLENKTLKPDIVGNILEFLCSHEYEPINEYSKNVLKNHSSQKEDEKLKSIQAAKTLLIFSPQNSWDSIKTILHDDFEWSREVIKNVANDSRFKREMFENYSEDQLADLFILVYQQYPESSDQDLTGGAKFLQADDFISFWRRDIINYLEKKGNSESIEALKKINVNLPEIRESIAFRIIRAQEITRLKSWSPPKPQEIYDLFQNSSSRFIQSGENLLDIAIESLEGLENQLQGRQGYAPAAINLWDHRGERRFRPKPEEDLSDYIKNHFINDFSGIVTNREVEIDPTSSPDLLLNSFTRTDSQIQNEIVSAVIEVKGSWHSKLTSAMQDQLLEKYMKPRALQYGLFLVGWFRSEYWDEEDTKKNANVNKFETIDDLKSFLENQENELSSESFIIKSKIIDISLKEIHLNRYRLP